MSNQSSRAESKTSKRCGGSPQAQIDGRLKAVPAPAVWFPSGGSIRREASIAWQAAAFWSGRVGIASCRLVLQNLQHTRRLIPRNGQEQCGRRFCAFLRHEMKDSYSSRNRCWDVRGDPGGVTQQARGHLLWSHVICQERLQIPWLFLAYSVHQSAATLGNGKRVGACGKYLHGRRMGSKKRFPSRCGK